MRTTCPRPTPPAPAHPPGGPGVPARVSAPAPAMALAALLALLPACSTTPKDDPADLPASPRPAPSVVTATDLNWTKTSEIRFSGELVGYLVEVLEVPDGVPDRRAFKPGSVLIEDRKLELLGFISPGGTTYTFDERGAAKAVGFGTRNAAIASFFRKGGTPQLVPVDPLKPG